MTKFAPSLVKIATEVRRLATEYPDMVYRPVSDMVGCQYMPDQLNPQGCIVGAAARSAGFDLDSSKYRNTGAFEALLARLRIDLDRNYVLLAWVEHVQSRQDIGDSWSEAVALADARLPKAAAVTV